MKKYLLFTIHNCPFCDQAKEALNKEDCVVVDLSNNLSIRAQVKNAFDWKTFPIILERKDSSFNLVGGYTDLKEKLEADGRED